MIIDSWATIEAIEGIDAHINAVWAERFGYRPPVQATEQEPAEEPAQGGAIGTEGAPIQVACRPLVIEFVQHQGPETEQVQCLRIELPSEGSLELVVKFRPVDTACCRTRSPLVIGT